MPHLFADEQDTLLKKDSRIERSQFEKATNFQGVAKNFGQKVLEKSEKFARKGFGRY